MPAELPKIGWPAFDPKVGDEVMFVNGFDPHADELGLVVKREGFVVDVEFKDGRIDVFKLTINNAFWQQQNVPDHLKGFAGLPVITPIPEDED